LYSINKQRNSVDPNGVIANWLRNRNTIEYLGLWESLHNPNFNPLEFEGFRKEAGLNAFTLSPSRWVETTNAIGLASKSSSTTFAMNAITYGDNDIKVVEFNLTSHFSLTFLLNL
jgi:hypothetical protein